MRKKRKYSKPKHKERTRQSKRHRSEETSSKSLHNEILTFVFRQGTDVTISDILQGVAASIPKRKELNQLIDELIRNKELLPSGKKRFRLDDKGKIFSGKLDKNPRGFGFVTDLQPKEAAQYLKKDPFLSVGSTGSANHGDRILIRINRIRKDDRPEAEIITILERSSERITGFFASGNPPRVIPEDPRYPSDIIITGSLEEEVNDGDAVVVQILPDVSKRGYLAGKIEEILGPPQNIDVQMKMVIENFNLPHHFSDKALAEAESLNPDVNNISGRNDLRNICHVTIDGETAKDFDDAIAVEKTQAGYRLYVSIADVSHYVKPGSALDKEAYIRGTSIYFPGRVIPMLPERLSNDLCSLVPLQDRYTFTAILDFDESGRRVAKTFCKSIIQSRQRFAYTTVKEIVVDKNSDTRKTFYEFVDHLKWAEELARILLRRRIERGSIGFNIPEPEITLENDGNIKTIARAKRNFAHQIIEEFMLAANEAVAQTFTDAKRECIYRIHEKPDIDKVEEFAAFARTLGIALQPASIDPSWFAKVLVTVKDSPTEYVVNNLLLRAMKQARYDSDNDGHFGLAATDYTHFTSPIRRYPDLLVHRYLESFLQNASIEKKPDGTPLKQKAIHLSARERTAINAERDMNDRLKVFFMMKFVGQRFDAIISGVSESQLYVELLDLFVSGAIDINALKDDYYLYDAKRYRLIGELRGKIYQIGNAVKVRLVDIDPVRKRLHFIPDTEEERI